MWGKKLKGVKSCANHCSIFKVFSLMESNSVNLSFYYAQSLCGSQSEFIFVMSQTFRVSKSFQFHLCPLMCSSPRLSSPLGICAKRRHSKLTDKSNIVEHNLPLAVNSKIIYPLCLSCNRCVVSTAYFLTWVTSSKNSGSLIWH